MPRLLSEGISEEHGKEMVEKALVFVNPALATVGKLVAGKDLKLSLQAGFWRGTCLTVYAFFRFSSVEYREAVPHRFSAAKRECRASQVAGTSFVFFKIFAIISPLTLVFICERMK